MNLRGLEFILYFFEFSSSVRLVFQLSDFGASLAGTILIVIDFSCGK